MLAMANPKIYVCSSSGRDEKRCKVLGRGGGGAGPFSRFESAAHCKEYERRREGKVEKMYDAYS